MRAVWSFWTRPFKEYYRQLWISEKHHLLAWVLSVEAARKHYPETALITDDDGAALLVDRIGLNFQRVSTELSALRAEDARWFNLGKLHAYRSQEGPFVHIDSDVFLWKPLPPWAQAAPIFAQNPELFPEDGVTCYRPEMCQTTIQSSGGWLPDEWIWYNGRGGNEAVNCGVLGGNHTRFIGYYADQAISMMQHLDNQAAWKSLAAGVGDGIMIEQYFLSACIQYHKKRNGSSYSDVALKYLFSTFNKSFEPKRAKALGYTHLINGAKKNADIATRLEERVRRDHPEYYDRCVMHADEE